MNNIDIGKRLIKLRGDMKREKVAADLDISVSALAMYETGQRKPRDEVKMAIANYYGVSVQSLFFDTEVHNTCTL